MNFPSEEAALGARESLLASCATMEKRLSGLLDSKGKIAEEVHSLRKLGKSLRGGFTLFGLEKSAARQIQAVGRLLAGTRDAVSRRNTWAKLAWSEDPLVCAAIQGLLDQDVKSAAHKPPTEAVEWCIARVTAAHEELLALEGPSISRISTGLQKLFKKVEKRSRRLSRSGEEDFHNARKALKAYLGAIKFLPEGTLQTDPRMTHLADLLGDENDLTTLSVWLCEHGFTPQLVPGLWEQLKKARKKLREKAIVDTEKLGFR